MEWAYRNMLVQDSQVVLARSITETLAPSGGQGMFTTALSDDGSLPATYWISSGLIDAEYAQLIPLQEWTLDAEGVWQVTVISAGMPEIVTSLCNEAGLEVTLAEVNALFAATDITLETPQESWARLGIQLVQQEIVAE